MSETNTSISDSLVSENSKDEVGGEGEMEDVISRAISPILLGVTSSLALFGMFLAIAFLSFNIKYRESRLIKMSSPNLNIFIGIGAICIYACVMLFGVDLGVTSSGDVLLVLCKIRIPLLTVGFTLVYGSMFSKAWRVYRIFTHAAAKRMVIRDGRLVSMVAGLLLIDAIILTLWLILDAPQLHRKLIVTDTRQEDIQVCQSKHTEVWFTVLFTVKAAVLLMGTYISWETRNVTVPSMNDAKCIVVSVYTCVILVAMATALMTVLEEWPNAWYTCVSVVMLVCPTELLLLQYIPKIRAWRNNPDASYSMSRSLTSSYLATNQHRTFSKVEEELFLLSKENASLKRALSEKDNTIKMLHEHVGSARKKLHLLSIDPEQRQDSGCDFDMSSSSTCQDDREIIGARPPDVVKEEASVRDYNANESNRQTNDDPHKLSVKHNDIAAIERQNLKRRRGRDGGSIRSTGSMRSQQSVQQFEDLREAIVQELHHAHDLSMNLRDAITHDLQSCRSTPMYMVIADTERELAGVLKDSYKLDGDNISISSSTFTYDNPVFTRKNHRRHSTNSLCVCNNSRQSSFRSVASITTDMTSRDDSNTPSKTLQWPQYIPPQMPEGVRESPHVVKRSDPSVHHGKLTKSVYHTYV